MSSTTPHANGMAVAFTEHSLQVDGWQMHYWEAGQGSPVVILHDAEELTQSPFLMLLAQQFRVIAIETLGSGRSLGEGRPAAPRDAAHILTRILAAVGLDHYVLVSAATSAPLALWQAIEDRDHVDALVLISPVVLLPEGQAVASGVKSDPELVSRLGQVETATLVLLGTNDSVIPPETGRFYVERLPNCFYVLVYDAGHAIAIERPDALYAAVCDFVQRRGAFIVEDQNTAINP